MTAQTDRRPRARSRRHRVIIPFALVLVLIAGTWGSWIWAEPDPTDQDYLSPTHSTDQAGGKLAELIRARGVAVEPQATASQALVAARNASGKATLFIPAPQFLRPHQLQELHLLPTGTRVVLVEPGRAQLRQATPPLLLTGRRWATGVGITRDCPLTDAAVASVVRSRYAVSRPDAGRIPGLMSCFDGALVTLRKLDTEFVVVGSADPFRDDRLSEHDNADLAADLLSSRPTLLWLVTREMDPPPPREQRSPGQGVRPPAADRAPASQPDPFPPAVWAVILLLLAAGVAVAIARGRRLGKVLPEPLPINVSGAETAMGRARLYERARARGPALQALRADAIRRIGATLGEPVGDLDMLAQRTGIDRERLARILTGPPPEDDDELHQRAVELQQLCDYVSVRNLTGAATPATEEIERD